MCCERMMGKQLFAYLFFANFSKIMYHTPMNLSIYEPDENEITKGTEPLEEDGTENILAFEMPRVLEVQKYMSVAEAAGIL